MAVYDPAVREFSINVERNMLVYDPAIRELAALLESPEMKDVKPEIREKLENILDMCNKRNNYAEEITTEHSDVLAQITQETMNHPWEEVFKAGKTPWIMATRMISGPITSQFLNFIVSITKAKQILEIGMFTGYTALSMAEALPADGVVITCEISDYLKDLTSEFFSRSPHGKKIKPYFGPARETLETLTKEGRVFDVVFVDADKAGYRGYVETILDNGLLAPNGIILADNALSDGRPYLIPKSREQNPINDFNEYIANRPDLRQVLLPFRDGILAIRRTLEAEGQAG
ncbi:O-methyltransferase MdmC [Patella vulgata]|uniref:O-methyltransferase MdmC n=1 Tax=Patella vulgata TaxID=6465 RepID=UPI00217F7ED3|nr:O-methyltransferase MdmC [Patella vulgata]